jgi:hypothetical protein
MFKVKGGDWLKNRDNYDVQMCKVNNWECVQSRHYDAVINGDKVEVKKTKTSATIIKLQQLAEIMLDEALQDVKYLIVRTTPSQSDIEAAFLVSSRDICEIIGMTKELAEQTSSLHEAFAGCTIQMTIKQKDVEQYRIQG